MTLLERLETPLEGQSIDDTLQDVLRGVPGAVGLGVEHGPVGTRAMLVVDDRRADFYDAEVDAMGRLLQIRALYPTAPREHGFAGRLKLSRRASAVATACGPR
ncbi:MAG: hypothetical protein M3R49_03695 [Chloroflexota bacterium]|nr:hypothetical protein [Chloroflexota bacterium]